MDSFNIKDSWARRKLFQLVLLLWVSIGVVHSREYQGRDSSNVIKKTKELITGVGGGFYRMKDQEVVKISSSNYGVDTYANGDVTVWRFFGSDCGVLVTCPCFDVPSSFKCFGDYLKISFVPFYDQKFCGEVKPQGIYRSVTGHVRVRFRSDWKERGQGFLCYVSCTAPGKADPKLPDNAPDPSDPDSCFKKTEEVVGPPDCPSDGDDGSGGAAGGGAVVPGPPMPGQPGCVPSKQPSRTIQTQTVNWVPVAGRAANTA